MIDPIKKSVTRVARSSIGPPIIEATTGKNANAPQRVFVRASVRLTMSGNAHFWSSSPKV